MLVQQQTEAKQLDLEQVRTQLQSEEKPLDFEQIRKQLQSRDKAVKAEAEAALQTMSAQELVQLVSEEQSRRRIRKRWMISAACAYVILILSISILSHGGGAFSSMFGSVIGVVTAAMAFSAAHQSATRALAKHDTLESVGLLVENLEIPGPDTQNAVRAALIRLLPRLRASDSHLLNREQRKMLLQHMGAPLPAKNKDAHAELRISALKALEQIGDETFVPVVERFANDSDIDAHSKKIQQAARDCLPYLLQRVENDRASHQLLRASAPDHRHDADVLLRPAQDKCATRSDELLRPG